MTEYLNIDRKQNKSLQEIAKERKMSEVLLPDQPGLTYGIEQTKDVVKCGISLANAIISSLNDGKVTLTDIPAFIIPITKIPPAISGIDQVPFEINNLDETELQELKDLVKAELDVDDAKAKLIIEDSITLLYNIYDLVKVIKG